MADLYDSHAALAAGEREGVDYQIRVFDSGSPIVICRRTAARSSRGRRKPPR